MSIIINNDTEQNFSKEYADIINKVIAVSLDQEKCPYEIEVSVTITNNEEIRKINREHRDMDKPTDVLSFPLIDFTNPSEFDDIDEDNDEWFDLDTGELMLGDIIISLERAYEQAKEYGHSIEREIGFLTAHSMLHLMGYDHIINEEEQVMNAKQQQILNEVGLKR
ncbi:rRNA maturation RNase YbeY [Vallitalea guaymasensis]|uniref:rRNA maturation RNase YbeY n=1 Tax=Vallitalea guaymasensis TaxID=1185412 RepID=UPI00272C03E0|nr:rRNA maturation RNase YbeY [Vallitalea guaymasensis]